MKNITIALPEIFVENIEKIQELGMVHSRSEGIRLAVYEFIKRETHVLNLLGFRDKLHRIEEFEEITIDDLLLFILERDAFNLEQIVEKIPNVYHKTILDSLIELQNEGIIARNEQLQWIRVIV